MRACQTVEPEWIERLVAPVLTDGFDYVSPYYLRHVNEGAITKGIVYPMFRALYGVRLRQPAASEFGCSGASGDPLPRTGLLGARAGGGRDRPLAGRRGRGRRVPRSARRCSARAAASRGTAADLSTTLAQVVGALFDRPRASRRRLAARQGVGRRSRSSAPFPRLAPRRRR